MTARAPLSSDRPGSGHVSRSRALPGRQVLTESVYEAIREQIMNPELAPGSRVNMDQLARELEVSTTPVREALTRLESEGLVTRRSLQGYSVTAQPGRIDLHELFTMRMLIEPEAASQAAGAPDAELLNSLHVTLAGMAEQVSSGPQEQYRRYRTLVDSDARFHDAIAAASGNRLLRRTFAGMHCHVLLYRLYFEAGVAPEREQTAEEHRVIIGAIAAQQPERAATAMRVHIEHSHERVLGRTSAIRPS